ncbi:diguanylate cyclase [Anaerocolumna xylanovorans]|uniref:Diguanylate cyclase (GGDEF) domain-containing protein n=1 Tax=Anaerocolumna xylanovorans DSM 12503 TaxID=1121345 RepID=A0A1M7XX67_9FIRM|nr:diguanylate cyclase [Anaerocolumna xylanovorans]SHO43222.1 diguanylate cyclase (GGDEF) domain-containing protein [Anaerocolumna xylanovorans DSM 12503]
MIKRHTIASAIMIAAICTITSVFFWISYQRINMVYQEETQVTITNIRKQFLKDTVNNIIQDITADRENEREHYKKIIDLRYKTLSYEQNLSGKGYADYFARWFGSDFSKDINENEWTVFLWNDSSKKVLYDPASLVKEDIDKTLGEIKPQMLYYRIIAHGKIYGFIGVSKGHVDNRVKETAADKIRKLKFDNGSYVWVNEIIHYTGGKDYAIRLVHPNLPKTEGVYLSTDMTDIKGNRPYAEELAGVKAHGELFFTYYFKELDNNIVSEKLTYAKLYKDFNWVIDMGIPLNDIRQYIDHTNAKSMKTVRSQMIALVALMVVFLSFGLFLFLLLERFYAKSMRKQMELEMNKDTLSKAHSRRYGTIELVKAFKEYKKNRITDTAIIMFDVDDFKGINDNFGHDVGDKVLTQIVNRVYQVIRSTDCLIRWGGDEFVGIFRGLKEENSVYAAEKVVTAIADLKILQGEEVITPTISLGIAYFEGKDETFEEVLKRADTAMYMSKREGKNKVSLYRKG